MTRLVPRRRRRLRSAITAAICAAAICAAAICAVAVCAISGLSAATSEGRKTSALQLAFENGDEQQLALEASLLSARNFGEHLVAGRHAQATRRTRIAAALAVPTRSDAADFLDDLAIVANSPDRVVSIAATRSAHEITTTLTPELIAGREITRAELGDALSRWHAIARNPRRRIDVRVVALEVSERIASHLADKPGAAVVELITDDDPQMRTAAFELLPAPLPAPHQTRVAAAIESETDPYAIIAAAAALCGGADFGDDTTAHTQISTAAKTRLADLVSSKRMRASDRLDASFCLVGSEQWTGPVRAALIESLAPSLAKLAPSLSSK